MDAAASVKPRESATSWFVSCSPCRSRMISRSSSSSSAMAASRRALHLAAHGRRRRRQFGIDQLPGQLVRRVVRQEGGDQRLLAVEAAPLRLAVAAMGVDDVVLGDVPQPEVKGHERIVQIVLQPAVRFEQHVLHDVAGIDARRQRRVQA